MKPEGKVKAWGRGRLQKYLPGHWHLMPQGGTYGTGTGTMDYVGMYEGVPFAIEYKADEDKEPTPIQWKRIRDFGKAKGIVAVIKGKDEYKMHLLCSLIRRRAELIAPIIAAEDEPENANQSDVISEPSGV